MITMWFISLAYPFGIVSITLRSGIGVVSGITSMIYTLSCILYVLSENTFSVPSKSSQESILTSFLPENQYFILNYITVGNVVLSVWNRQNRQFRHMSFLYFAWGFCGFQFSPFRFPFYKGALEYEHWYEQEEWQYKNSPRKSNDLQGEIY